MSTSISKRGVTALPKNRGSGFENGFADPPVTPDEYDVEREIYSPHLPFHERIEECIQRFQARRRMDSARAALFSKYLALGGVDTSQRQFTGTAKHVKDWKEEGYTADDIRGMTANDYLSREQDAKGKFYNPEFPEHWDVDFAGVVAGFLGSYLPAQGGVNAPEIRLAADTILNFLKYIRHHDVCPEYSNDVNEAIRICEASMTELPQIAAAAAALPGDFHLACRILFCSSGKSIGGKGVTDDGLVMYEDKGLSTRDEIIETPGSCSTTFMAPAGFHPELVFKTTIALQDPNQIPRLIDAAKPIYVVSVFEEAYEVDEIVFAEEDMVRAYEGVTEQGSSFRAIGPVGFVALLPTSIEDGWDNRPCRDAVGDSSKASLLLMDHEVLTQLRRGMKLRLTICELDIGVRFIREVREVLPSFHVFLPQSLMLSWKTPRLSERPAPSADDPDAEERHEQEKLEGEDADDLSRQRKVNPALDRELRELEEEEALEKAMECMRK